MKKLLALLLLCSCQSLVMDTSVNALDSGDYTMAMSACSAMPGLGADICRVKEGAPIDAEWRLIMPKGIKGGEIEVHYQDITKSYPINGPMVVIPFKDVIGDTVWKREYDGEVLALAQVRFLDPQGVEQVARARGIAFLIVTAKGYDPLAIDSGFATSVTHCDAQYSTAGRGALKCW